MLKENVQKALNEQIKLEAYSSNLYLSMASWADTHGFPGSAAFLYQQAEEERIHMLKLFKYVNSRDGHAIVSELKQPPTNFNSLKEVFAEVLTHEKYISQSINDLVGICYDQREFTTANFLQWYVNEQIEEESTAKTILDRLNLLGDDLSKLYMFDRDLVNIRSEIQTASSQNA